MYTYSYIAYNIHAKIKEMCYPIHQCVWILLSAPIVYELLNSDSSVI